MQEDLKRDFIEILTKHLKIKDKEYTIKEIIDFILTIGIKEEQIFVRDNRSIIITNYYRGKNAYIGLMRANNINNRVLITIIQQVVKEIPLCNIT